MKKIMIFYWNERDLIPKYKHGQEFDYSNQKRNEIIQVILEHGFSIMVKPNIGEKGELLTIYISKKHFTQS